MGFSVIKMDFSSSHDIRILLNNRISIMLANDNFVNDINTFIKIYPKIIEGKQEQIESIDFRYGNGFAVKWK